MRLCNPDILIRWRSVEPPRYKKDYEGRLLRVTGMTRHAWEQGPAMPPPASVCRIERRFNPGGTKGFELEVSWQCPACAKTHLRTIPESWLTEEKAHFVVPDGIADYSQTIGDRPPMLYLATSYSHPDPAKRGARANLASECAAWLIRHGWSVYSPLSMGHAIWAAGPDLETDFSAWREPCLRMLEMSDALVVLLLDGIHESVGVAAEIEHARKLGIPLNQVKLPGEDASQAGEAFEIVHNPRWWR